MQVSVGLKVMQNDGLQGVRALKEGPKSEVQSGVHKNGILRYYEPIKKFSEQSVAHTLREC